MADTDLYNRLGVARTASQDEIRKAYRRLARKHHPDVNPGNQGAEARFKEISTANDVLSDEKKRAAYDEFGDAALRSGFDPEKAREHQRWQAQGGPGSAGGENPFDGAGAGSPFGGAGHPGGFDFDLGDLLGFRQRRSGPTPGDDIIARADLDLAQALAGIELQVDVPAATPPGTPPGKPATRRVTVRIPAGADHGSRLRVPGLGQPGHKGGPPGDLYIETHLRPHPYFRREGLDLYLTLPVTLDEAYLGATLEVPTPEGQVKLKVPPRSQTGQRLRLRGKGVRKDNTTGDLYADLQVRLPEVEDPAFVEAVLAAKGAYKTPVRQGISL